MYRLPSAGLRPLLSTLCILFASQLIGCAASHRLPLALDSRSDAGESVPEWVGQPLSWSKLEEIQAWQASSLGYGSPFWKNEAELTLAEGRLTFAQDSPAGAVVDGRVRDRLLASHTGFERILARPDARPGQRERASAGKRRCLRLLEVSGDASISSIGAVVSRDAWGAKAAKPANMTRSQGPWRRITVHHSAMSDPIDLSGRVEDSSVAVRRMQRAHMQTSGYGDVGYHFFVDPWGRIFQGRELRYQGAHAGGSNNVGNVGICLIGNFDEERPTQAALETLETLVGTLRSRYGIPATGVVAHSDLKSTNCPGRHLRPWIERYRSSLARR